MDNKDVVRAVEEAWDGQNLDALDQYFAPEFDNSTSAVPGLPPGLAHQGAMQSFPDRKVNIEEIVGDGDTVAIRTRVTGTNDGGFPLFNVPANGAKIDFPAVGIYRLRDGKIVGHWGLNDALTLMMQLGAIQPPA
jgi:predicted SnoaL-like aldol condensation-catalyzing enzyme